MICHFKCRGAILSLKENVEMVREELNSEEKFFENAVKTERFVKKYKTLLISGLSVIILGIGANIAYDAKVRSDIDSANAALTVLSTDSSNEKAQNELKTLNPDLFDAWKLSEALKNSDVASLAQLKDSKAIAVGDIASYQNAVMNKDIKALESYSMRPQAIYKDLALFELAVLLIREDRIDEAHAKLQTITEDSPLYRYAQPLMHYGVK
jgi:predicted negative regulator of RcsB-dependent stress response